MRSFGLDAKGAEKRHSAGAAAVLCFGLALFFALPLRAEPPSVLATIKPVHSLAAALMRGVAVPDLLLRGAASPHEYSLRPSDAERIGRARIIFWIGPFLESFLIRPFATLDGQAQIVELATAPGVKLLSARTGGLWEEEGEGGEDAAGPDSALAGKDEHFWLDPENAKAMAAAMLTVLAKADPPDAPAYRKNGEALMRRLDELDRHLGKELSPVAGRPFVVFHDAYQYLERRYGLTAIGSITVHPESQPGARRVAEIRRKIAATGASCVFSEAQFEPRLVEMLVEGSGARTAALDEIGADLPEGPEQYFEMMHRLGERLESCLGNGK
jgi:zinc transport system substrate-binding protein